MISSPKQFAPYADRDLDCQQSLEGAFRNLLSLAEQVGWDRTEAARAIQELALNHLAMEEENRLTALAIHHASQMKH